MALRTHLALTSCHKEKFLSKQRKAKGKMRLKSFGAR